VSRIRLGAHLPWTQIDSMLDKILELGLAPEIAIKGPDLDSVDNAFLDRVCRSLSSTGIKPTVHAPFFDLNPGALDPLIRQVTYKRLSQSLSVAEHLDAHLMVIHPGFDKWRYPGLDATWLSLATDFFPPLIEQATSAKCRLALENIYEETPGTLVQLVDGLDSEWLGHCFDAGHWHLFGKQPMADWLELIGPRLFHLHLHDNRGLADEHLPVGEGIIDFNPLLKKLNQISPCPSITLEAHTPDRLIRSLSRVEMLIS